MTNFNFVKVTFNQSDVFFHHLSQNMTTDFSDLSNHFSEIKSSNGKAHFSNLALFLFGLKTFCNFFFADLKKICQHIWANLLKPYSDRKQPVHINVLKLTMYFKKQLKITILS